MARGFRPTSSTWSGGVSRRGLKTETLDTRLSDRHIVQGIESTQRRRDTGRDASTASSLGDAVKTLLDASKN